MLDRTHRFRRAAIVAAVAIAAAVLAGCADTGPDNKQNATSPRGPYARKILDLTQPFFWIAVVIGLGVLGGTIYVALRFRVKPGEDRAPKQVHGNTVLEVSWTIIPALILAVMAVPTVATIFDLAKKPTGANVLHITVTARQWWWEYKYDDDSKIETANEMHIPVGVPVSLSLKGPPACSGDGCYANGVIHSFWVPELNGKKDVVPGRTHFLKLQADRPGTYDGQCAEYCGLSHADMRLRVIAETPENFRGWEQRQVSTRGEGFYKNGVNDDQWQCSSCHSFDPTKPGAVGPDLTHVGDRHGFAGSKYEMPSDNLWRWVLNAPSRKPMGKLEQHMPNFEDRGMSQDEAQKIACFLLTQTATTPKTYPECQSS